MSLSGRLGKNVNAYLAVGGGPADGPFETAATPNDLDWDLWLGAAPKVDYCPDRQKMFRWFFEYSGGKMTDWGAHHIDIAQMALGASDTGPIRVKANGGFPPLVPDNFNWDAFLEGKATLPNGYNTATKFSIDLEFANGSVMNVNHAYAREADNVDFGNGILLEGDKGRIFVNRSKLVGRPMEELTEADPDFNAAPQGYVGDIDRSPSKIFLLENKDDPKVKRFYELAVGKRPPEELYDVRKDPDQVVNLAADPARQEALAELRKRLDTFLKEKKDPRQDGLSPWDSYPYTGPVPKEDKHLNKGK